LLVSKFVWRLSGVDGSGSHRIRNVGTMGNAGKIVGLRVRASARGVDAVKKTTSDA
jgi:hypothetical protein